MGMPAEIPPLLPGWAVYPPPLVWFCNPPPFFLIPVIGEVSGPTGLKSLRVKSYPGCVIFGNSFFYNFCFNMWIPVIPLSLIISCLPHFKHEIGWTLVGWTPANECACAFRRSLLRARVYVSTPSNHSHGIAALGSVCLLRRLMR